MKIEDVLARIEFEFGAGEANAILVREALEAAGCAIVEVKDDD